MADLPAPSDDQRLLHGLAAGQEEAFSQLYDLYAARLYRTAVGILGRSQDAEDCVQEVFAALVRSRSKLPQVQDLAAYLFVALRRQAARHSTSRRRQPASLTDDYPEPPQAAVDPRSEALAAALRGLTVEQREVIALKINGELTFAEIGQVLKVSPNTAASRYRYALERLRERLNPWMQGKDANDR